MREREWEAAHTFWLWPDISPSMEFRSHLSRTYQARPRAGADAGRRRAAGARGRAHRAARADAADGQPQGHLAHRRGAGGARRRCGRCRRACRRRRGCRRFSSALLFGDFLDPPETIAARLNEMAEGGVSGHLVQVLDPAEETLAYEGRMEFRSPEGGERWIADRVETPAPGVSEAGSPRTAPRSRRRRAASAGRSWCITPTGRRPSRC